MHWAPCSCQRQKVSLFIFCLWYLLKLNLILEVGLEKTVCEFAGICIIMDNFVYIFTFIKCSCREQILGLFTLKIPAFEIMKDV